MGHFLYDFLQCRTIATDSRNIFLTVHGATLAVTISWARRVGSYFGYSPNADAAVVFGTSRVDLKPNAGAAPSCSIWFRPIWGVKPNRNFKPNWSFGRMDTPAEPRCHRSIYSQCKCPDNGELGESVEVSQVLRACDHSQLMQDDFI